MEDILEVLLGVIVEIFGEVFIEILLGLGADLVSRAIRGFFVSSRRIGRSLVTFIFAVSGVAAGFLSAAIFPHPLVHPSRFHGVGLLISPVVTGLAMGLIGRMVQRCGRVPVRIESFSYGFVFALTMSIVRFFQVK